jgi:hypothetical protein
MSESGQDAQNEDFFGDFHAANGDTVPQIDNISDQNHPNSNETTTKVCFRIIKIFIFRSVCCNSQPKIIIP